MRSDERTSKDLSIDGASVEFLNGVVTIEDKYPDSWITLSVAEAMVLRDWLAATFPASAPEPLNVAVKMGPF